MRPNIIVILADDMGYGDFSRFNGGASRTPTLDALMDQGVCLTQQYTASPVCNPSRAALLTGRYPHRTGSVDTLEWRGLERLSLRERTLADALRGAGYRTGLVGKWHLGAFDPRYHPDQRGFDETVCFRGGMHDYYQWRVEFGQSVRRTDGRYLTDVWTQEACEFIDRNRSRPFFLHVTFNAPHTPLQAPADEILPFVDPAKHNRAVATIYAMIHRMDKGIARILETLNRHGLEDNTIVLFSSDNGPQFGGSGEQCTTRFNCQFNGAKGSVLEGGIRVPGILRWPAGLDRGRVVDEMVHFTDWYPTLLEMAGIQRPPDSLPLDGVSVLPALRGEKGRTCTHRYWQWNRYTPLVTCNAAVRDGDWKLVRPGIAEAFTVPDLHWLWVSMYGPEHFIHNGIDDGDDPPRTVPPPPPPQLFNLAADPLEKSDLAAQHPDRASRMLCDLEAWFENMQAEYTAARAANRNKVS